MSLVVFTDQMTELSGTLLDSTGAPISDLSILLFSTDRTHWNGARRMRGPTQPANDGTFRFPGLAPGEYYLAALSDPDPDELRDPGVPRAGGAKRHPDVDCFRRKEKTGPQGQVARLGL